MRALMTRKSCAVGMRNAILRNYLNRPCNSCMTKEVEETQPRSQGLSFLPRTKGGREERPWSKDQERQRRETLGTRLEETYPGNQSKLSGHHSLDGYKSSDCYRKPFR